MDQEIANRALEQALALWIEPEISRRKSSGHLPEAYQYEKAQIIFNVGKPVQVRLDDEVKAVLRFKKTRDLAIGEPEMRSDVGDLDGIELTDEDPEAAHITIIRLGPELNMAFDFRYFATRVSNLMVIARQFIDVSSQALASRMLHPAVENLFAATELLAKCHFLLVAKIDAIESKKHGYLKGQFNLWGNKLRNVDSKFVTLLNRLWDLRPAARYAQVPLNITQEHVKEMLDTTEAMYDAMAKMTPPRFPSSSLPMGTPDHSQK